jgi:hypothetical protein
VGGEAECRVAGIGGDVLHPHYVNGDNRHHREPSIAIVFSVAGTKNRTWGLIDTAGGIIDEDFADSRNQFFKREDISNFLL